MKFSPKEKSVSPMVGIAVLVAIAVILSALVFTTTGGILTEQQAPSAGANVTIASESTIQVQLDSVQNADNVYVQSPLGTRYELEKIGDTVDILNIGNEQKPVLIAEKDGEEHVVQGITPRSFNTDYVVNPENEDDFDTIQAAINTAKSNGRSGEVIAVAREHYNEDITVDTELTLVAEDGTVIEHSGSNNNVVTVESEGAGSTVTNFNVDAANDTETAQNGFNVNGDEVTLKSNQVENATGKAFNLNAPSNTIIRNIATSNGKGLSIQEGAGTHVIRNNDFSGNGLGAENLDTGTADLRKNKWGVENPQEVVSGSTVTSQSNFAGRFIGDLKEKVTVKNRPRGVGASTVTEDGDLVSQSGGNQSLDWFSTEITIFVDGEPITIQPNGTHSFEIVEDPSGQADNVFDSQEVRRESTSSDSSESNDVTTLDSGEKIAFDLNEEETSDSDVSVVVEGEPSSRDSNDSGSNDSSNSSGDSGSSSSTSETETITVTDTTPSSVNTTDGSNSSEGDSGTSDGTNDESSNSSDSTTVKTQPDLEPPQESEMTSSPSHEVEAGPDFSAVSNQELKFIAAVDGVNPDDVSFTWNLDDGTTQTGQEVTHTYKEAGEYRVSVTSEYNGEKSGDSLTVDISEGGVEENYAPIVRGEITTEPPFEVGGSIEFSASNSFDPDGSIASYKWDFNNDGEFESTGETTSYKFASAGEKTVELEVTDENGASSSTTKILETHPSAPNADFTITSETPLSRSSPSMFDASSSSDFDGSIVSYEWDLNGDGATDTTGETASYNFSTAGTVDVTLTVTDNDGKQGEVTKSVEISNKSPDASYTASSTVVQSGIPVELDASASSDPEGDALSYEWEFSDGSTASGEVVEHSFSGDGHKTATLTVTDEYGASSTYSETFTATTDCKTFDSDTTLGAGTYNYACVLVKSGVTVKTQGDPSEDGPNSYGGVKIKSHGDIIVNGELNGLGQGYPGNSGPGITRYYSGGSYGGLGEEADNDSKYGSEGKSNRLGSGGYHYDHEPPSIFIFPGGGSVWLVSEEGKVDIDGSIEMDSERGGAFGGSGGSIRIEAPEVTGSGTLSAEARYNAERGGGGRILINAGSRGHNHNFNFDVGGYTNGTVNESPIISDIEPAAEIGSTGYASAFTPHYNDPNGDSVSFHWDFGDGATSTMKSPNHVYTETGTYTITLTVTDEHGVSSTYTEEYTVEEVGSCVVFESDTVLSAGTHEYPCVEITSGTTVTTRGDPSEDGPNSYGGVKIKSHGDIIVNGELNGLGQGYPGNSGPGITRYYSGGSYGGLGEEADNDSKYGSEGKSNRLGSGGYHYDHEPPSIFIFPGGGSVWLISEEGKVDINGSIEMDSERGGAFGGSGGSIRIEAPEVTGSGTLSAEARYNAERGGGGRILIDSGNKNYNFNFDVGGYTNGTVVER